MKKQRPKKINTLLLFFTIALSLVFSSCKSKKQIVSTDLAGTEFLASTRCNLDTPGWGENLGIVSFATDRIWTISGNGVTQIWSDVVTATHCQKTTFDRGIFNHRNPKKLNFNADCRSNQNFPGNLFSWCAVARFKETLCPHPWRVPTEGDFVALDKAMGGTGENGQNNSNLRNRYLNDWGGVYGGYCCSSDGSFLHQGSFAYYWSQSEANAGFGFVLTFQLQSSGLIYPQLDNTNYKHIGFSLRCVR